MISIIVPVLEIKRQRNIRKIYRQSTSVKDLLSSIQNQECDFNYEVILVLNNPDLDPSKILGNYSFSSSFALLSDNFGVSRAWNIGASLARYDYLAFVNDDATLGPTALQCSLETLQSDRGFGNVGPEGAYWENGSHRSFYEGESIAKVHSVSGFYFLTPRSVYSKIGGFDDFYTPASYEEIDYCFSVTKLGLKNVVNPAISVKHSRHHGISTAGGKISYMGKTELAEDINERNRTHFINKWGFEKLDANS